MIARVVDFLKKTDVNVFILLLLGIWIIWYPWHKGFNRGIVAGDSVLYYAYLQSIFEDGDIQFLDDYLEIDPDIGENQRTLLPTGYTGNMFPPGPAILWSPFYLLGKGYVGLAGAESRQDEMRILVTFVEIGTGVYACLFLFITYFFLKRYFKGYIALAGTLAALFCTPIYYYAVGARIYSHVVGAFAFALFIRLAADDPEKRTKTRWALLGLVAGLVILCRWMDGIVLAWLVIEQVPILYSKLKAKEGLGRLFLNYLVFAVALIVVLTPQIILLWVIYGPFKTPMDFGANKAYWDRPELVNFLFSSRHGLLSWHPVLLLSMIGLGLLWKRDKQPAVKSLVLLIAFIYLSSIMGDWWAGDSFGARRMVTITLVFALGFAALLQTSPRRLMVSFLVVLVFFAVWNKEQAFNKIVGNLPGDAAPQESNPLNPDRTYGFNRFGYPLTLPGNLLMSLMLGGIPPEEADWIMSTNLLNAQHSMEGRILAAYPSYRAGFSAPEGHTEGAYRILDNEGTVLVNRLFMDRNRQLRVIGEIENIGLDRNKVPIIEVLINGRRIGALSGAEADTGKWDRLRILESSWKYGVNEIRLILRAGKKIVREGEVFDRMTNRRLQTMETNDGRYRLRLYEIRIK